MEWTRGRMLSECSGHIFEYNAEGVRIKKDDLEYVLDGDRIIAELLNGTVYKRYFYDNTGIAGMAFGESIYYFRKNLQGDVVGIVNSNGTLTAAAT